MSEGPRTFSFVDRIHRFEPGVGLRGSFAIPRGLAEFPAAFVVEAIGQLACWGAMAESRFELRPVAGLCARIEVRGAPSPGEELELEVEQESLDTEAVSYSGRALSKGKTLVRLEHAVGPMLPMHEFEDPKRAAARFEDLISSDPSPGGCADRILPTIERTAGDPGHLARATLRVPHAAPYFSDHFPLRPVYPGTLLMCAKLELVRALAQEVGGEAGSWPVLEVRDVKMRTFTAPGEELFLEARWKPGLEGSARVKLTSRNAKRAVGGATVTLGPSPMRP